VRGGKDKKDRAAEIPGNGKVHPRRRPARENFGRTRHPNFHAEGLEEIFVLERLGGRVWGLGLPGPSTGKGGRERIETDAALIHVPLQHGDFPTHEFYTQLDKGPTSGKEGGERARPFGAERECFNPSPKRAETQAVDQNAPESASGEEFLGSSQNSGFGWKGPQRGEEESSEAIKDRRDLQ